VASPGTPLAPPLDVMLILSEVVTLVSMIPNCWCSLEVATTELHLSFVLKGNVLWKRTFIPMVSIVVLHHKHMKLVKPFTPHVIAWSVRKGFNQSICRTKERKTRLQCLSGAMPKPVMTSGAMKSEKLLRRKSARIWQYNQNAMIESLFLAKLSSSNVKALTRAPEI